MSQLRVLLLAGLFAGLAACGPAPEDVPPAGTTGQATPEQAAPPPAAAANDSVPPTRLAMSQEIPAEWRFEQGRHFQVMTTARPRNTAEPIEVIEFFWYGCPFCFSFEPVISRWKQGLPDDVAFVRIPVIWGATEERYARLYYTAETLGRLDDLHEQVFRDYHLDNRRLRNDDDVQAFFGRHGVPAEEFRKAWGSFSVNSNLNNARRLTSPAGYNITATPTVVVNGRYKAAGEEVRTFDDVLAVTEELILRERQARLGESGGG